MATRADERATARARALVGKTIDGRYQVDRILAMGGMGAVYLARHLKLKKRVALKALHPDTEDHPELIMRFEREALAGAQVSHPNVACATDFGDLDDGTRYLVTEYVKGETLRAAIDREAPFDPTRAVLIARQIAVALAEIHARGIVHRDLKPRNVMLAEGDFVKVVDFGLAKIDGTRVSVLPKEEAEEDARLTARGVIFGTVEYLAPEAAFGMELVDARADLYALGVMLFEMLSGKHPFEAKNEAELFAKQRLAPAPSIRERNPSVHVAPALEAVVQRLLRKDFDERYQDARAVIAALDEAEPKGSMVPPEPVEPALSVRGEAEEPLPEPPGDHLVGSAKRKPPPPKAEPPKTEPHKAKLVGAKLVGAKLVGAKLVGAKLVEADPVEPEPLEPERLALPPRSRSDWWRTPTAVFVAGTALALGVLYLAVHRDIETQAPASADASAVVSVAPPSAAPSLAASADATPSAAPTILAPASASAAPAGPSVDELASALHSAVEKQDTARGADALRDLLAAAPSALREPDRVKDAATLLRRLADKPSDRSDETWKLVALSDGGPDLLYRFIELGASRSATRAHALLETDAAKKLESPALRVAFTLHDAPCNEKLAAVDEAVKEGDERSLAGLEIVAKGCVRDARSLDEPIRRLRDRLRHEKGGASPR